LTRDHLFKAKRRFLPNHYVLLAGLAGLIPDVDLPISIFLFGSTEAHRLLTHSIWFPLIFFSGFLISYFFVKKRSYYKIFLMLFVGFSIHILLDSTLSGTVCLFCPFNGVMYGLNALPVSNTILVYASIDALLLFFWLIHEELEHKISDYF
jgi:membrane-bound metal-dependent hydrolase YbcI (DUF457 family)